MKKYLIALSLLLLGAAAKAQQVITVYDENTGKEETIGLPEGMQDGELDSMMRQWCARTYLTYDSAACESTGEDIAYEPEVYVRRLQNLAVRL